MGVFSVRKTTESFIEEAKNKHDNKYDYSKVDYKTTMDKIIIICPIHGMFTQTAMSHTKGFGCKKCGVDKRAKNRKSSLKEFILKSNLIHNDFYDYDNTEYKSSAEKVEINCPIHGYFKCRAGDHINKSSGCPKCKNKKLSLTIDDFILRSNDIHNNRYSYDKVEYINSYSNVIITCNEHGDFSQQPSSHLKGNGCHQCGRTISNAEIEIKKYLESHNIDCDKGKGFLDGKDVDIISKKHKICIEYNGLYWHSELFKRKEYHLNKTKLAENLGYNLIHIFEDEWKEKKNIVKSILLSKFRKGNLMKMGILKDHQTEHEAMLENKYLRIYDCGKIKYSKIIFKQ
jgi:very-short-patch-repair endonuclease